MAPNTNRVYTQEHTDRRVPTHSSAFTITKNVETTRNKQYILNITYP